MKDFLFIQLIQIPGMSGENKFKIVNPTPYELIGKGAHGAVFKLNDQQCVKIFENTTLAKKEAYALNLGKELAFIPKVYETGSNYIVMEYMKGPDLKNHIKNQGSLSDDHAEQILMIFRELKQLGFTRINLHLRHLIVTGDGQLKLIDHANSFLDNEPYLTDLFKGLTKLKQLERFLEQVKKIDPEFYAELSQDGNIPSS